MDCHGSTNTELKNNGNSVALVGHPNVGKSALFQRLTGQFVAVSNYPGTTIEVSRAAARALPETTLVDTPGVIAFPPHSEDEEATARVLFNEPLKAILQVGDAKNIRRTLLFTVQLAEMGLPMVMVLNMMDEARECGVIINQVLLSEMLSVPVIPTIATRGQGIEALTKALQNARRPQFRLQYPQEIEAALAEISIRLPETPISARSLGLLWLSGDRIAKEWLSEHLDEILFEEIEAIRDKLQISFVNPLASVIQKTRLSYVNQTTAMILVESGEEWHKFSSKLGQLASHSLWGTLILVVVLLSVYWFVGLFGAGTLVDLLEVKFFGGILNPWIITWVDRLSPFPILAEFLVGEYGLWTMGMTYALALILPIVTTFFLAFGIMEDSGYLPRLAALSNRLFSFLGLNGKAVLPMVLGLGCVTMATLTTRLLENKRERLLVTLLLALAVPCSAQLGVVMGMLAGISLTASLIWGGIVFLVLLVVGWLAARLVPGERTQLLIELPPLRWPLFSNMMLKTLARLEWYLKEVIPLFLMGTALMFTFDKVGLLSWVSEAGKPLITGWLGLPPEASSAFLMGFLRRDFGATGLFDMQSQGLLSPLQVVVSMVTITLFIPCIASVMVIAKERGWRMAAGMMVLIFPLAFLVGGLLNRVLLGIGWQL